MKVDFAKLDRAFNPKCVVVVGDSGISDYQWLDAQKTMRGKLYSVAINPKSIEEIKALGYTNYTSLLDIPEPIDLAILCVPRAAVPQVLDDCIRKDVAVVHMFTAGYSETETEEGIKAERAFKQQAEAANLHIVGPNCMGLYNPLVGIRQSADQQAGIPGAMGVISQSGAHAVTLSVDAFLQGLYINKSASFGNGTILDSADFLEYFAHDPGIKAIAMYLEGVKDAERFLKVLKETTLRKPVVIWKGGRTAAGSVAIASHTGSMAVPITIWSSVIKQQGGIIVNTMEELIDTTKAFIFLPPVTGDRVGITGGSGGQSVNIADAFNEVELNVPALTRESYDRLQEFYSIIGGGYRNPVDTGNQNRSQMKRIVEILIKDANIDNLVLLSTARMIVRGRTPVDDLVEVLLSAREMASKPMMAIITSSSLDEIKVAREVMENFQAKGIPAFPSIERCALSLKNVLQYYLSRRKRS